MSYVIFLCLKVIPQQKKLNLIYSTVLTIILLFNVGYFRWEVHPISIVHCLTRGQGVERVGSPILGIIQS